MTIAIVKNGVFLHTTNEPYIRTEDGYMRPAVVNKDLGFYEFIPARNEASPTQKAQGTTFAVGDGVVTETYLYVDKTQEEIKNETNSKLDAQIVSSERQALETGLVRTLVEDLMNRALDQAGLLLGMTLPLSGVQKESIEAMLLDEQGQYFSKPYAKIHANAAERAALRTQRI